MLIKIEGKRRIGKSRLLAHYIKDAQKHLGHKVLLTGRSLVLCMNTEKAFGFKADKATTSEFEGDEKFDVLAIEETSCREWKKYLNKYRKNLSQNAICIITGDLK